MNVQRHFMEKKGRKEMCIANIRKDSRTDIGRVMDQKTSGTEHIRTNRMDNGIESLRT